MSMCDGRIGGESGDRDWGLEMKKAWERRVGVGIGLRFGVVRAAVGLCGFIKRIS